MVTVRLLFGLVVASLIVCLAEFAMAKGIFITPGTRANSMGAAYVGIADDPSAIYWNPAGLSQLDKSGAQISAFYTASTAKSNVSLTNDAVPITANGSFPLTKVYPTEPAAYLSKDLNTSALVPFAAGYTKVNDIVIAVGYYASGGGGGKWDSTMSDAFGQDTINADVDAQYSFLVGNVSASKQFLPNLSVGIGLDIVTMNDKKSITKAYSKSATSVLPAFLKSYSLDMETLASGYGFQFNVGGLYKPQENLRVGVVFRSGTTIKLSGQAKLTSSGLALVGTPDGTMQSDYDQNYPYPMTYGVGVSYEPYKAWTIAGGVDFNNYSTMKNDTTYKTPIPGVFTNTDISSQWKDTTQLRLGAEYRVNNQLAVRSGIQTDPVPLPGNQYTLLELNQYNETYFTVGAGYLINAWDLDFSLGRSISDTPGNAGRSYEYPINIYRLAAGYKF